MNGQVRTIAIGVFVLQATLLSCDAKRRQHSFERSDETSSTEPRALSAGDAGWSSSAGSAQSGSAESGSARSGSAESGSAELASSRDVALSHAESTTATEVSSYDGGSLACVTPASIELSAVIETVAVVSLGEAQPWDALALEYWSDDELVRTLSVNLGPSGTRTFVTGLRPDTLYSFRFTGKHDGQECSAPATALRTGSAPATLPLPTLSDAPDSPASDGYLLTTPEAREKKAPGYIAIYDRNGVPVWWYQTSLPGLISRAHLSWDGQFIWARDTNPMGRDPGKVVRVAMDGSSEQVVEVPRGHHDFTATPSGFLFLVGGGEDDCDIIQRWSDEDGLVDVYALRDAFGETFKNATLDPCHCNSIDYNTFDESISVSCLNQNAYVNVSSRGELNWVLGGNGEQSHFTGDVQWDAQHGHHLQSSSRLLFFNNRGGGDASTTDALAVELELDLEQRTARRVWQYASGVQSAILGDAQYLSNGNVLVTYSTSGEVHEVSRAGGLVRRWVFPEGIGYAHHSVALGPFGL